MMDHRTYGRFPVKSCGFSPGRSSSTLFIPSKCTPAVRQGYVDFVSRYVWHCFATLTWRTSARGEQVQRDIRTWLSTWMGNVAVDRGLARWEGPVGNQRLKGSWVNARRRGWGSYVWVAGIEPHQSGRLHAHVLIMFPRCFGDVRLENGWELWFKWHGMARLEIPQCQDDVTSYVSKYVTKEGSELVLSDSFKASAMLVAPPSSA